VVVATSQGYTVPGIITISSWEPELAASSDGHAIALHADNTLVSSTSPAQRGEMITVFLTGMGSTDPPVSAGAAGPAELLARVRALPVVTVGGKSADISYAGLTPGLVGLYQISFTIPCSSSSMVRAGLRAPRRSPGHQDMPRSASLVGLTQRGVIPQNNSTRECSFMTQ
jgi:uncharacterized protein (TIGR03437 family)